MRLQRNTVKTSPLPSCTALHLTTFHCNALRCSALHCTVLRCTTSYYIVLHCTAMHYVILHCTALYCDALVYYVIVSHVPYYFIFCCPSPSHVKARYQGITVPSSASVKYCSTTAPPSPLPLLPSPSFPIPTMHLNTNNNPVHVRLKEILCGREKNV